jgi:hypothetical protein
MPTYAEFFLNCPARVVQLELIEISHPNFSQDYRVVRNKVGGAKAWVVPIGGSPAAEMQFDYYPLRITSKGDRNDLDYGLQIDLGDLGDIVSGEVDNVAAADGFGTKPKMRYWTFRSDDMTSPLFGPVSLEIPALPMTNMGTSFEAAAPALNSNRTGEMYLISRFPTLKGTL